MRDERCKQSLRNLAGRDESRMVSWASVLGMSLGKWAEYWQAVRGGVSPHGRKAVKEGRAPAALLSSPALLFQGLTSCSHLPSQQSAPCCLLWVFTIAEGPLMCFWTDGIKSVLPFPSLPLVCVSAVQWELGKLSLKENNVNKNTFLSVGGIVVYTQVRLFPLT